MPALRHNCPRESPGRGRKRRQRVGDGASPVPGSWLFAQGKGLGWMELTWLVGWLIENAGTRTPAAWRKLREDLDSGARIMAGLM